jgi:Rrf2 family protein
MVPFPLVLQFTKRTEYGLIALVHLMERQGEFVSVREICERQPIPRRLVAEVLKELGRAQLVDSQRGAGGGYCLALPPENITLGRVIAALEGAPGLTSCGSQEIANISRLPGAAADAGTSTTSGIYGDGECDVRPTCPIRSPIHTVRDHLWGLLERTTLRSLGAPAPGLSALSQNLG